MAIDTNTGLVKTGSLSQWAPYIISTSLAYILLCSLLRYNRQRAMHRKFMYPDRQSLSCMTNDDAQAILSYLAGLEFPKIMEMSLQFALFKTYGIPTISSLLVETRQFSSPEFASKRYTDTTVLIEEILGNKPKSERVIKAIARMNYIHSRYQKAGKISNEDLLFTLSVFILEPITWVNKYEWRTLSEMEICAVSTFWKSVGDAMGIKYDGLLAHSRWRDGLEFYDDLKVWAYEYEVRYMLPAPSNQTTADQLVPLLLFYVPKYLKDPATHMVGVLMGDRLRRSMSFPTPPAVYFSMASVLIESRKRFLRYLSLPRPGFMRVKGISETPGPTGRYHMKRYLAHPYYNKPSILNRWGPQAWFVYFMGGDIPDVQSKKYIPEGYMIEEIGPNIMLNKGQDEMAKWEQKLKSERPTGCPFAFAK